MSRLISREGFILHQIGNACERGGRRYPFKMDMVEIFQRKSLSSMVLCDHAESYRLFSQYAETFENNNAYMTG